MAGVAPVCPMTAAAAALGSKSAPVGDRSPGSETETLDPEASNPPSMAVNIIFGLSAFLQLTMSFKRTSRHLSSDIVSLSTLF